MSYYIRNITLFYLILLLYSSLKAENKVFNEFNLQPEVWHFVGPVKSGVDSKGDLNLSIPVLTVPGRGGLNFEVKFNYRSGIQVKQRASWIGLGWEFDPGSITRDPQGAIVYNSTAYNVDFTENPPYQPDAYYISLPSGTYPMSRSNISYFTYPKPLNTSLFYTTERHPWKIEIVNSPNSITIDGKGTFNGNNYVSDIDTFFVTIENGIRYIFSKKTLSPFRGFANDFAVITQNYVNAWRLEAILGTDYDGSVIPSGDSPGSWVKFTYTWDDMNQYKTKNDPSSNHFMQTTYLHTIETPTHKAIFHTEIRNDIDFIVFSPNGYEVDLHRKLTSIELRSKHQNKLIKKVELIQDFELAPLDTGGTGKNTLKEIKFWGEDGRSLPGYKFEYANNPILQSNPSIIMDYYGYYSKQGEYIDFDTTDAKAWSMTKIIYPTGGSEEFEYENDYIASDKITYNIFINENGVSDTASYKFENARRQGGVRVKRILRKDGMGNSYETRYTYGPGRATGVPPYFWNTFPWASDFYTPGNRGSSCVIYEFIRKTNSEDNSSSTTYYTTCNSSGDFSSPIENPIKIIESTVYCRAGMSNKTIIQGNQNLNWGKVYHYDMVAKDGRSISNKKKLFINFNIMSHCFPSPAEVNVIWGQVEVEKENISKLGSEKDILYVYNGSTRLPSRIEEKANGIVKVRKITYAHDLSDYGGTTWEPGIMPEGMRKKNMLSQIAREDIYERIEGSTDKTYYSSTITTWKKFDVFNIPIENTVSFWKPFKIYNWADTMVSNSEPSFNAWLPDEFPSDDRWLLTTINRKYDACGNLLSRVDARNDSTLFYYGDNQHNLNNNYNGLFHAYLTGIKKENLNQKYDYDQYTGNLTSIENENGNKITYIYDNFQRLSEIVDAKEMVTNSYSYFYSQQQYPIGQMPHYPNLIESIDYQNGNYIKNGSFENINGTSCVNWQSDDNYDIIPDTNIAVLGVGIIRLRNEHYRNLYQSIPVENGKKYLLSCWFRSENDNSEKGKIYISNSNSVNILNKSNMNQSLSNGRYVFIQNAPLVTNWKREWVKFESNFTGNLEINFTSIGSNKLVFLDAVIVTPIYDNFNNSVIPDYCEPITNVQYFDGLARGIQNVTVGGSYNQSDEIIAHTDYNYADKAVKIWKPYLINNGSSAINCYEKNATNSGSIFSAYAYYDGNPGPDAGGYPYLEYDYLPFPESFPQFIYPYGNLYHSDHFIKISYSENSDNEIPGYSSSTLLKTLRIDENGNASDEFQDFLGRQVAVRKLFRNGYISAVADANANITSDGYVVDSCEIIPDHDHFITYNWYCYFTNLTGICTFKLKMIDNTTTVLIDTSTTIDVNFDDSVYVYNNKTYRFIVSAKSFSQKGNDENNDSKSENNIASNVHILYDKINYSPLTTTLFEYDIVDNLLKTTDPSGKVTEYKYNTLNQLIAKTAPDLDGNGNGNPIDETLSDPDERYKYDENGNLRFSQDANRKNKGEVSFTTYDFANRPLKSGIAETDFTALDGFSGYSFEDDTSNWIEVNKYDNPPNPNGYPWHRFSSVTQYTDSLDNLLGQLSANAYKIGKTFLPYNLTLQNQTIYGEKVFRARNSITAGPDFTIDSTGNVTFRAGKEIRLQPGFHARDGSHFNTSIDTALYNNTDTTAIWQVVLYSYDKNSRVNKKYIFTEDLGVSRFVYHYNAMGNIIKTDYHTTNGNFYTFYDYNSLGQLSKIFVSTDGTRPTLCEIAYTYNPTGAIESIRYNETSAGVFDKVIPYNYTIRDWIDQIGDVTATGEPFAARYGYDYTGNITTAEYYNKQSALPGQERFKYDYSYDTLYRLTAADYSYHSGGWQGSSAFDVSDISYDSVGNILSLERRDETGNLVDDLGYTYGNSNRLLSVTDTVAATSPDWDAEDTRFSYDPNGNVIRVVENGTAKFDTIEYDHRNLPVRIVKGDGTEITYRYNAAGQRIYKKVGSQTPEHYILDSDRTVAVYQNGAVKYWNILAGGVAGRIEPGSGSKFYYLKDHLGSTRAVMDAAGNVKEALDYYPFGLLMPGRIYQSGSETKEKYTGKERDSETGLDYFGARYYSAALGRWISPDPITNIYMNNSPYIYSLNKPINLLDVDGREVYDIRNGKRIPVTRDLLEKRTINEIKLLLDAASNAKPFRSQLDLTIDTVDPSAEGVYQPFGGWEVHWGGTLSEQRFLGLPFFSKVTGIPRFKLNPQDVKRICFACNDLVGISIKVEHHPSKNNLLTMTFNLNVFAKGPNGTLQLVRGDYLFYIQIIGTLNQLNQILNPMGYEVYVDKNSNLRWKKIQRNKDEDNKEENE